MRAKGHTGWPTRIGSPSETCLHVGRRRNIESASRTFPDPFGFGFGLGLCHGDAFQGRCPGRHWCLRCRCSSGEALQRMRCISDHGLRILNRKCQRGGLFARCTGNLFLLSCRARRTSILHRQLRTSLTVVARRTYADVFSENSSGGLVNSFKRASIKRLSRKPQSRKRAGQAGQCIWVLEIPQCELHSLQLQAANACNTH